MNLVFVMCIIIVSARCVSKSNYYCAVHNNEAYILSFFMQPQKITEVIKWRISNEGCIINITIVLSKRNT